MCVHVYEIYKYCSLLHTVRYYGQPSAFQRLLTLLANEVVAKTRDIVGDDLLADPLMVCRVYTKVHGYSLKGRVIYM